MSLENTSVRNVLTHYGPRSVNESYGGETAGESGVDRKVEYIFDYNELRAFSASDTDDDDVHLDALIPAGARITSATFDVLVAFTSTSTTTDLDVGLWQNDNDAVYDADGLLTAAQLTQTVIGTLVRTTGTGDVINKLPLTEACRVQMVPTVDDLLTGRARLIVTYTMTPSESALY